MKFGAITLVLLLTAVRAFAGSDRVSAPGPVDLPGSRDAFYCQTTSESWNAFNASSGFQSEEADDIPASYVGYTVGEVTIYVAEWAAGWQDPTSITVNFYNAACPPNMTADYSMVVPYQSCTASLVYSGSWYVYSVLVPLPEWVTIGTSTSVGAVVNQDWGQNPPYCGLVLCDTVAGCGGYWAGDFWGYPRWTPFSDYFGYSLDLAYCIGFSGIGHDEHCACCFADGHCEMRYQGDCEQDGGQYQGDLVYCDPNPCIPTAAKSTTWGKIRSDYR